MIGVSLPSRAQRAPDAMVSAETAWLEGPGKLTWRTEPMPRAALAPDQIACETIASVISPGTELAAWRGANPLRAGDPYPRVQGYCNVAKALVVGDRVEGIAQGDRVLTLQSHRSHFVCSAQDIYLRLDPDMDAAKVATSYLFHLGYNAVLRSGARAGHRVSVIGLGVLGLTSVAMAAMAGAEVYAVSDHQGPRAIAQESYGASGAYCRRDHQGLMRARGPGADIVILTTNGWDDFQLALDLAGQNAVIACLGFPGRDTEPGAFNPLAADPFYTKQLRIEGVGFSPLENDARGFARFNLRDNLGFVARSITGGALDAAPLLSGVYPARHLEQAYADLAARKDGAITYWLDWTA